MTDPPSTSSVSSWDSRTVFDSTLGRIVYGRRSHLRAQPVPNRSESNSIDFAFLGHSGTLVRIDSGETRPRDIPAGTGGFHGGAHVDFVHVDGPSEFIEVVPTNAFRTSVAEETKASIMSGFVEWPGLSDLVLWTVAHRFRAFALEGESYQTCTVDEQMHLLLHHIACGYFDGRRPRTNDRHLSVLELRKIQERVLDGTRHDVSLPELAAAVHRSPYHFIRVFRATTGLTPSRYIQSVTMHRLREHLLSGWTLRRAAAAVGYHDGHSLRRAFRRLYGASPSERSRHSPPS
ncbi:MAG: helix-turn-helix domain-containing protein [Myxococcota bacterium]